jgi:hypothetical protein
LSEVKDILGNRVEIVSLIFNKDDVIINSKRDEVNLDKYPQDEFLYTSQFLIEPGEYKCRIVIGNLRTGRAAVGASLIKIPPP